MTSVSGKDDLQGETVAARKTRILVVDDDERFVRFLADLLDGAGYCVVTARTPTGDPRHPPGSPRRRLGPTSSCPTRRLQHLPRAPREVDPDLPVIFISGERVDPFDRAAGIIAGGDDYLVKPLHPEELLARTGAACSHAHAGVHSSRPSTERNARWRSSS